MLRYPFCPQIETPRITLETGKRVLERQLLRNFYLLSKIQDAAEDYCSQRQFTSKIVPKVLLKFEESLAEAIAVEKAYSLQTLLKKEKPQMELQKEASNARSFSRDQSTEYFKRVSPSPRKSHPIQQSPSLLIGQTATKQKKWSKKNQKSLHNDRPNNVYCTKKATGEYFIPVCQKIHDNEPTIPPPNKKIEPANALEIFKIFDKVSEERFCTTAQPPVQKYALMRTKLKQRVEIIHSFDVKGRRELKTYLQDCISTPTHSTSVKGLEDAFSSTQIGFHFSCQELRDMKLLDSSCNKPLREFNRNKAADSQNTSYQDRQSAKQLPKIILHSLNNVLKKQIKRGQSYHQRKINYYVRDHSMFQSISSPMDVLQTEQ